MGTDDVKHELGKHTATLVPGATLCRDPYIRIRAHSLRE